MELVRPGMVIGLGTGSTAREFVLALAEKVGEGLDIVGIPSSRDTEQLALAKGIPLVTFADRERADLTVDGADEVDPEFNLIKGLGGALVREKILASASASMAVIVDDSKMVERLGVRAPVPVEVIRFGAHPCQRRLEALGAAVTLRSTEAGPFVSDNGNYVLDARFEEIPDAAALEAEINCIPGVVDNGLFVGLAEVVVVGTGEGARVMRRGEGPGA